MLALCYHHLAQRDATEEEPDQRGKLAELAKQWWDRATLLIPASALMHRHPDLKVLPGLAVQDPPDVQGNEA